MGFSSCDGVPRVLPDAGVLQNLYDDLINLNQEFPMQRRNWIAAAAAVVAMSPFLATNALAQAWPARPIKLVVPFPPGALCQASL